jgi:sugar O-acyltransferase (sialic acid O-acetyltransferase NeuD family)
MKSKKNQITLIGFAAAYAPVIFDLCHDVHGSSDFHIYKNIEVPSDLVIRHANPEYNLRFYGPGTDEKMIKSHILFGVTGPYAKRKVFDYFRDRKRLESDQLENLVHSSAVIAPSVFLSHGVIVEPAVVISAQSSIAFGVTLKRSVSIGHHCDIQEYVEINPGVTVSGRVTIRSGAVIGSGAILRNGIKVGKNSVIGMGSVVTKDVPENVIAYGNPCKVIREINNQES